MKTAIIIAGGTRQVNLAHKFWDKLPTGDLFYSTWDLSNTAHSNILYSAESEIKDLTSKVNFKAVFVSDYKNEYLNSKMTSFQRPFYLLNKVRQHIKDQGYQRVIYFRPDLKLFYLDNYNPETEFDVDDKSIKLLGLHHNPEEFIDETNRTINDTFFVFSWSVFELLLDSAKYICDREIHNSLFEFFKYHGIKINPITNMRCVILRENINESNINLGIYELTELFMTVFNETLGMRKSFPRNEYIFQDKKLIDFEYLERSRNNGGILKLRNK